MGKRHIILLFLGFAISTGLAQKKDTIFIKFNDSFSDTKKESYQFSAKSNMSFGYFIRQMEKETYGDKYFLFSYASRDDSYYEKFGGKHPTVLIKNISFLKSKRVLGINFFRSTPYHKVVKTFEEENSRDQDVIIFMLDEDEIVNDRIILREVNFTRPVKE